MYETRSRKRSLSGLYKDATLTDLWANNIPQDKHIYHLSIYITMLLVPEIRIDILFIRIMKMQLKQAGKERKILNQ